MVHGGALVEKCDSLTCLNIFLPFMRRFGSAARAPVGTNWIATSMRSSQ
jgi:hypothetical protein